MARGTHVRMQAHDLACNLQVHPSTPAKMKLSTCLSENTGTVQILLSAAFQWLLSQYICNSSTFMLQIFVPHGAAMLVRSSSMKSRRRSAYYVHFRHACWPCSKYHRHRLPDTKWQPSHLDFSGFQT